VTDGQTHAQTDGRTSCDGITRAVHARRAVKSDPESTRGSGSPLKVNQSFPMPATFGRRPFPHSSIILFTEWQNDRLDPNPNFRINPYPCRCLSDVFQNALSCRHQSFRQVWDKAAVDWEMLTMSKNPLFRNGEENENVIRNPHTDPDLFPQEKGGLVCLMKRYHSVTPIVSQTMI